ncbi:MAG: glycosyltransferase family 2 protein [Bacteroidetes bacterium]|nr:MAG: glycosyltransferase family 2 protein [Bacteroidota bacterium]
MLSVVIITKNEERNIGRCLESLQKIADEIIVIDGFSIDQTQKICEKYGVKFVQNTWLGYSETKNFGNSLAKHDYILSLDADEALSEELQKSLILLKKNGFSADSYQMNRLTSYCGQWIKHCGWHPDRKLRLWNKNKGFWQGIIHEKVEMQSPKIEFLQGNILHWSYYNISEHIQKANVYSSLGAENNFKNGKKGSIFKILFSPLIKFLKSYVLQTGFLDGFYGFVICSIASYETFLKYLKTRELEKK